MDAEQAQNGGKRKRDDNDQPSRKKRRAEKRRERQSRNAVATADTSRPDTDLHTKSRKHKRRSDTSEVTHPEDSTRSAQANRQLQDPASGKANQTSNGSRPRETVQGNTSSTSNDVTEKRPILKRQIDEGKHVGPHTSALVHHADDRPSPKKAKKHKKKSELQSSAGRVKEKDRVLTSDHILNDHLDGAAEGIQDDEQAPKHPKEKSRRGKRREKVSADSTGAPHISAQAVRRKVGHLKSLDSAYTSWLVSKPLAGRYLEAPAHFSADERLVLFATETSVLLGNINSSVNQGPFDPPRNPHVTSYAFVESHGQASRGVCIGTSKGDLHLFDPKQLSSLELSRDNKGRPICALATTKPMGDEADVLIFSALRGRKHTVINVCSARSDESKPARVLKHNAPVQSLKVSQSGRYLIATTPDCILVGALNKQVSLSGTMAQDLDYSWREIKCNSPPTCLDFRITETPTAQPRAIERQRSIPQADLEDRLDIAYGSLCGCIYMYKNVVSSIGLIDDKEGHQAKPAPQELHWHREPVGAVAFSPDGNYLVSGGQETVLVLWQLDTGRQSFLPHLESPIRTLSISPSGSMYAVGTADNTIMILSTAELKPIAHFASLQSPSSASLVDQRLILATKETLATYVNGVAATNLTCAINPKNPRHLLLAAPSHQSSNTSVFPNTPPSPYLQTYDYNRNFHVSRQALARTNATSTNLGPDGNKLHEPNIKNLKVTANGQWLATVDEWRPPRDEFRRMTGEASDYDTKLEKEHEIHLRIWRWNERDQNWMLNTSLPSPHELLPTDESGIARVLALEVSPADSMFATIGEDRMVRVWTPRTRRRDGKVVQADPEDSTAQTWWALRHSIPLEGKTADEPLDALIPTDAKLAWSGDGSLIAAWMGFEQEAEQSQLLLTDGADADDMLLDSAQDAQTSPSQDTVHFIDADAGTLRDSRACMLSSSSTPSGRMIEDLAFADRHFLVLSRTALHIWDLPQFVHLPTIQMPQVSPTAPRLHLAVNHSTNTFAVAVPFPKKPNKANDNDSRTLPPHAHRDFTSRVQLFSLPAQAGFAETLAQPRLLLDVDFPHLALALLSADGNVPPADTPASSTTQQDESTVTALRKGYVLVDSNSNVRRLQPPMLSAKLMSAMAEDQAEAGAMEHDEADEDQAQANSLSVFGRNESNIRRATDGDHGEPVRQRQARVVPSQKLAEAIGQGPILRNASGEDSSDEQVTTGALPSVRDMFDRVVGLFWGKSGDERPS